MPETIAPEATWNVLSRHAQVLLCLAEDSGMRMRDISNELEITERSVQKLIAHLERAQIIRRRRDGRNNRYEICYDTPLGHRFERKILLEPLLAHLMEARCREGSVS